MEELGKALKSIFDKLSDFFDLFDLSFFVSGVATTLTLIIWLDQRELISIIEISKTSNLLLLIMICYINGLISFAAGRWIRMGLGGWLYCIFTKITKYDRFDAIFLKIINAHGLNEKPLVYQYLERKDYRGTWRLYVRFWAIIREDKKYANTFTLLRRYWVMAATYDGLAITLLTIIFLLSDSTFGIIGDSIIKLSLGLILLVFALLLFIACLREADRYVEYQIEEVVGVIATFDDNL